MAEGMDSKMFQVGPVRVLSTKVNLPKTVVLWRLKREGIGVEVRINPVHEKYGSTIPRQRR